MWDFFLEFTNIRAEDFTSAYRYKMNFIPFSPNIHYITASSLYFIYQSDFSRSVMFSRQSNLAEANLKQLDIYFNAVTATVWLD